MRRQVAARGCRSLDEAWQCYADLDAWPGWSPQISRVRCARRTLAAGIHGEVIGPVGIAIPFEVLDVDEAARQWTWRVSLLAAEVEMTHLLGTDGDQTVATLVADGPAMVVLPYLPLAVLALGRLTRADVLPKVGG